MPSSSIKPSVEVEKTLNTDEGNKEQTKIVDQVKTDEGKKEQVKKR